MNQLQEEQQRLENQERDTQEKIRAKKAKIAELDENIKRKEEERNLKADRLAYYQGMLASNNARGSAANLQKAK